MKWSDFSNRDWIILAVCFVLFLLCVSLMSCASTCKRNTCCPKEGHGPCPICPDSKVLYGRKDIIDFRYLNK